MVSSVVEEGPRKSTRSMTSSGLDRSQGGEMARRVAAYDWARTPLGPRSEWPPHLRSAVDICLNTRVPLMLAWGPDAIQVYNDALAPLLGEKHPDALGRSYADSFAEIWDYQGPKFRAVLESGHSTYDEDQQVCFWRNGILEEMYYTFSWSPIHDRDGSVDGAFHPATETTRYVVGARRLVALRALAAGTIGPRTPEHACRLAAAALREHRLDMPFALFYLLEPNSGRARLAASMGVDQAVKRPSDRWEFPRAHEEGVVTVDVDADHGTLLAGTPWPETCRQAMVLPFTADGPGSPAGFLVAGLSPRRPLDDDYVTWLQLMATQLGHALAAAEAHERDHTIAVTLQRSLLPETLPNVDGAALQARYRPALEYAQLGGDWYDAICVDDDELVLVTGDVVGKGVQAAATMGRLRSAMRAYAMLGMPPSAMLEELNRLAVRLDEVEFATVLCAHYKPSTGRFVFASAGHLPPLVVRQDGTSSLVDGGLTVPLAATDEMEAHERQVTLHPEETLLLYTDGLVERHDQDLDEGLAFLLSVCASNHDSLPELLDVVMEDVAGTDSHDDVALLALRRTT
jgi:hypothetical protein